MCIRQLGVGFRLLLEQNDEGIHHEMNMLLQTFSSIPNELTRALGNRCGASLQYPSTFEVSHLPAKVVAHRSLLQPLPGARCSPIFHCQW